MTDSNYTTIEINGVKLEVDLRHAKRIEQIRVGSRVKVLKKHYDGYAVAHGVVIGFEPFEKLPTIIIAALDQTYNEAKVSFIYYNSATKETEVVVSTDDDQHAVDKEQIISLIDRDIDKKRNEISELENRKAYFLSKFQAYWEPVKDSNLAVA